MIDWCARQVPELVARWTPCPSALHAAVESSVAGDPSWSELVWDCRRSELRLEITVRPDT